MSELFATFLEGVLSFLSPCLLPMVPLYMAYLTGDYKDDNTKSKIVIFVRTLCFVLGVSLVFVLLTISLSFVKDTIYKYKDIIAIVGSVILFIFGLHELGIINISLLNKEAHLKINLHLEKMNYFKAFLFGFLFACAWTPCIGPMFTSAVLMTITSDASMGIWHLIAYCFGLTLPFLITGLATNYFIGIIKKQNKLFSYVMKIAGAILIGFSVYMFVGASNNIVEAIEYKEKINNRDSSLKYVPNNTFYDHNGNEINLEDYQGKYIFLNYTATWCKYCIEEIPEYQSFSEENDLVCLYVMSPSVNNEDASSIKPFVEEHNIKIPIIVDENNVLFNLTGCPGYPTIWVVGPDSSFIGYATGAYDKNGMRDLLDSAINTYENR